MLSFIYFVLFIFFVFIFSINTFNLCFRFYCKKHKITIYKTFFRYDDDKFFYKLFVKFPKQYLKDLINKKEFQFDLNGIYLFCGDQGCGKTAAVIHYLNQIKKYYPKCIINTNVNYAHQDNSLNYIKDIFNYKNSHLGVINFFDEISGCLNSKLSGHIPLELLGRFNQQRKHYTCLIGTAQRYNKISKELREQADYILLPKTYFKCITIVKITSRSNWNDNKQCFDRFDGRYWFVHDDNIRNAYDTYQVIENLKIDEFN